MIILSFLSMMICRLIIINIYNKWFKQGLVGDANFHYMIIKTLKRSHPYTGVQEFLIKDGNDSYPILFHKYAKIFSLNYLKKYPYIPNLIIWGVFSLFLSFYVLYFYEKGIFSDFESVVLYFVIFNLSASFLSLDMNGFNYISLSERLLARLSTATFFFCIQIFLDSRDVYSALLSILFGCIGLNSSMFSRQAILFIGFFWSIIAQNIIPIYFVILSFSFSILISPTYFLNSLRQQFYFSVQYYQRTLSSKYYQDAFSRILNFSELKKIFKSKQDAYTLFETREPLRIIMRNPEVIYLFLLYNLSNLYQQNFRFDLSLECATIIIYSLVSFKNFRHLGESIRYIEYGLLFVVPFKIVTIINQNYTSQFIYLVITFSLVLYFLFVFAVSLIRLRQWLRMSKSIPIYDELLDFLNGCSLDSGAIIATIPMPLGSAVCVRKNVSCFVYQGSAFTNELHDKYIEEMPFLSRDIAKLMRQFKSDILLIDKRMLKFIQQNLDWTYDLSMFNLERESSNYALYRIKIEA